MWSQAGQRLEFAETDLKELSTLKCLVDRDFNCDARSKGKTYLVDTISLNKLLTDFNCPREIDYLSIDTEGTELGILEAFEFSPYNIKIITVEHNFVWPDRERIMQLLNAKGFVRVFEPFSKWDDWYVKRSLAP